MDGNKNQRKSNKFFDLIPCGWHRAYDYKKDQHMKRTAIHLHIEMQI